jgi:glycosyltransferase involved in cell wall biosynthesis
MNNMDYRILRFMSVPLITIAIPTYNRFETLCAALSRLATQLTDDVCVLVIDNASTDGTLLLKSWVQSELPSCPITIHRNVANVGASANVARCFELCTTDWVWTLSDDDIVFPDAVEKIIMAVKRNPSATAINLQTTLIPEDYRRSADFEITCTTTDELSNNLDYMTNLLLISSTIHNVPVARTLLHRSYISLNTAAPHLAIILTSLDTGVGTLVLCGLTIVDYQLSMRDYWGDSVFLGVADVFTLVRNQRSRAKLLKLYVSQHPKEVNTKTLSDELLPLMVDPHSRQMSLSDYLYVWSKKIQFSSNPLRDFVRFFLKTALLLIILLVRNMFNTDTGTYNGVELSERFMRTPFDGRGA